MSALYALYAVCGLNIWRTLPIRWGFGWIFSLALGDFVWAFDEPLNAPLDTLTVFVAPKPKPTTEIKTHKALIDSQLWLNAGGISRHFSRNKDYNETNQGLGLEYRLNPSVSVSMGSFHNSVRQTTAYATLNWQPYQLGPFKAGANVGIMDGYPSVARGGSFFVAVPTLTLEGSKLGFNVGFIPSIARVNSAIFFQLKVRLF